MGAARADANGLAFVLSSGDPGTMRPTPGLILRCPR